MLRTVLLAFLLGASLGGCATPSTLEFERLASVATPSSFVLAEPIKAQRFKLEVYFLGGKYVADVENEHGTFYRGPKFCCMFETTGGRWVAYDGGIWMPRTRQLQPRVYLYVGEAIFFSDLKSALASRDPTRPIEQSIVPGLISNPSLSPSQTVATGVIGGVVEALIGESMREQIGKPYFFGPGGRTMPIEWATFEGAATWSPRQ